MDIDKIKNWDEVQIYLLEHMDNATDAKATTNPSFTKGELWNSYISQCLTNVGQELSVATRHILLKNIKREFG